MSVIISSTIGTRVSWFFVLHSHGLYGLRCFFLHLIKTLLLPSIYQSADGLRNNCICDYYSLGTDIYHSKSKLHNAVGIVVGRWTAAFVIRGTAISGATGGKIWTRRGAHGERPKA